MPIDLSFALLGFEVISSTKVQVISSFIIIFLNNFKKINMEDFFVYKFEFNFLIKVYKPIYMHALPQPR